MTAGDTCAADPIDTVHHEMDSTVRSHRLYIYIYVCVIEKQLVLEKELAGQSTR